MICFRLYGSYCNSLDENFMFRVVFILVLFFFWVWVDRYVLVRGGLVVFSVWVVVEV